MDGIKYKNETGCAVVFNTKIYKGTSTKKKLQFFKIGAKDLALDFITRKKNKKICNII